MNEDSIEFDWSELKILVADAVEGQINDHGRKRLNELLLSNSEARRFYREQMTMHSRLYLEYNDAKLTEFMPKTDREKITQKSHGNLLFGKYIPWLLVAACLAVLLLVATQTVEEDENFATIEEITGARWASSELPTSKGARIGTGTLSLIEGIAKIKFDSGAELSLEAPVVLKLVDAMNCQIISGTTVANVPESAIGFRIETPSATITDYGTRFAVNVDPHTSDTRTQVFEGHVKVKEPSSGETVSLWTGQQNYVKGSGITPAINGLEERNPSIDAQAGIYSNEWISIENNKDRYIGPRMPDDSEILLYVKNGYEKDEAIGFHRKAYIGFKVPDLKTFSIQEAKLWLHFEPTGLGLASHVPDAVFDVYGIVAKDQSWDEKSLNQNNAPANIRHDGSGLNLTEVVKLGDFKMEQGIQRGKFGIAGDKLVNFLQDRVSSEVTLIVVRRTPEFEKSGLVHGFASHRHPTLPAPTLMIRCK